jgi:hypothetical protein
MYTSRRRYPPPASLQRNNFALPAFTELMRTEYPAKVLLAWGEAIAGHEGLRNWLTTNGYPELGIFTYALRNKAEARKWLMDNGHPHLMAIITGIEGDRTALSWLDHNGMHVLQQVALTGDGDEEAFQWLMANGHRELAIIGNKMHQVKRKMDEDYGDYHRYARD